MRVEQQTEDELLTILKRAVIGAIYGGVVPANVSSMAHLSEYIDVDTFAGGLLREVYQPVESLEKVANAQSQLNAWLMVGGAQMRPMSEVVQRAAEKTGQPKNKAEIAQEKFEQFCADHRVKKHSTERAKLIKLWMLAAEVYGEPSPFQSLHD